uniref:Integrase catalytic domain-containing protein n=1 Tax=viral metagenome TaxID=1070528 RepID=A0A6C0EIM9_9ZZZZ
MDNRELLKNLYHDPKFGFTSKEIFKNKIKKNYPDISLKEVDELYSNLEINQMFKKPIIKKSKFYKITDVPLTFQIDIMIFDKSQKNKNRGIFMYLTLIDILSRKAFMYPLTSRKGIDIIESYNKFIDELNSKYNKKPVKIIGDDEFNFKAFIQYNNKLNIMLDTQVAQDDHIIKGGGNRLGIIDRFTKTIKLKIKKYQLSTGNINFYDIYKDILDNYNNTIHSSIYNNTPNEAFENKDIQIKYRKETLDYNDNINNKINLKIGDTVRAIKKKKIFDKENIRFSKKIYIIDEIKNYKYIIKDESNNIKKKLYKFNELQLVDKDKVEKFVDNNNINKVIKKLKIDEKNKQILKRDDIKQENIINKPRRIK